MSDKAANDRVYWHSRRGMLEIDLALMPFAKEVYPGLSKEDQDLYVLLLEEEDTTLFSWVLEKDRPEDAGLAKIMDMILVYTKTPKN